MSISHMVLSGGVFFSIFILIFSFTALTPNGHETGNKFQKVQKIAIIGSGIGGSATAHFIREILGKDVQISVFEKTNRVGGRLATLEIAGDTFESGGSIIHPRNLYMKKFVEESGLQKTTAPDGIFSLYDGKDIVFSTSSNSWLTAMKLLWRYGFSLTKMEQATKDLMNKFDNIYQLQDNGEAYQTMPDLLKAMNEEFLRLTEISLRKYLQEQGLSELLIEELVTAITRINYGQSTDVNAFTGMVSLAGAEPNLWSVKGGNWKVCEELLKKSEVILNKNTQIIEVIKNANSSSGGRSLYYLRSVEALINTAFDAVVLALPLEVRQDFIGCIKCDKWPSPNDLGHFQQTVATFVNGTPNFEIFQQEFDTVGTMEKEEIFFSSIGKETSVYQGKTSKKGPPSKVWKVFSREPLTNEQKLKLFPQSSDWKEVVWKAYPHYAPPEKFLPFVLDEGVFYVNAIERAASAMEMSALSARNTALLAGKYFNKTKPALQEKRSIHGEL